VGGLAVAFLVGVAACWCNRKRITSRLCRCGWRRYGDHRYARINNGTDDDVWLGGYVSMPRYVNP
jgi:hypothetical protein